MFVTTWLLLDVCCVVACLVYGGCFVLGFCCNCYFDDLGCV